MDWKKTLAIFLIAFIGMCGLIKVDTQCAECTGEGGKIGLPLEFNRYFK